MDLTHLKNYGKDLRRAVAVLVEKYSLFKNGNKKLSTNFCVKEFACKDGSDTVLIDTELVKVLQKIRDHFGKLVTINSAYRNAAYNKKIGGVSNSQHVKGTAADICINGVKPEDIAKYAEHIMPKSGGIGQYIDFVHVDTRANRSRWTNFGNREIVVSGFPGYTEQSKPLETVNDIVWELANRGIITDKELWLAKLQANQNAYWLAYKGANLTANADKHLNYETISDIVWELSQRKIITDRALWFDLLDKDKDLYWLAYKLCNRTVNKGD